MTYIKSRYRKYLPYSFRTSLRSVAKSIIYFIRFFKLLLLAKTGVPLKIVLGAALTSQKGWISTNEQYLDITSLKDWQNIFGTSANINAMLAEHVFEHLTLEQMKMTLGICYTYLRESGTLLIAVPDGNHPDQNYRKHTGINGIGADASDHKQFITYETLEQAAREHSFHCTLLEGFNKNGTLITDYTQNCRYGYIIRTRADSSTVGHKLGWEFPDANTSMIALLTK